MASISSVRAAEASRVRVPEGFEATLFAGDDLAHDIFAMTVDSQGRVVVSGPGYVKILVDDDGDGKADSARTFADGPRSGAQGMHFHGDDLLCIGDAGLIRYRDTDGDDRADGPPDVFLKLKTGGEHHTHAIRKGPDGWWYLIAGNHAGIDASYATLETSPVQNPRAGTLLRLQPDLTRGEIVAEGFRNAYDFAFNEQGEIFTYDSDGEREVSLPWYRPTRVFQVLAGTHAGWVSRSWKRPGSFPHMPPVVAGFGRGSPTGVTCYRHRQFPRKYRDAVFVADWTFGRVMAVPLSRRGARQTSEPVQFMTGVGQFGFAPTDMAVGPDGALYVSVGGRGTQGGVFRVTYSKADETPFPQKPESPDRRLAFCLNAPQPLSSWSRARWQPVARELEADSFHKAALEEGRPAEQRIRAIEILTELFGGPDKKTLQQLAEAESAEVRARAVWALGRTSGTSPDADLLASYLQDDDPLVVRCALEALLGAEDAADWERLHSRLLRTLRSDDRFVREAASRVLARMPTEHIDRLGRPARNEGPQAVLTHAFGVLRRLRGVHGRALELGLYVLERDLSPELKRQAVRLMQLGLGDVGPRDDDLPPVFDGYAAQLDLQSHERTLDPVRIRLAKIYPTGHETVDYELARLIAMLTPYNPNLLDKVLGRITGDSHPVDDIHHLIAAARIPVERTAEQREALAQALVALDPKIEQRDLNRDRNWDPRIGEMYAKHVELDPRLPAALLEQPEFGRPGHVIYLSELPSNKLQAAVEAFVRRIRETPDYRWTTDVVFVLGESQNPDHWEMVRQQFDNFALRGAVLMVLAEDPQPRDRAKFVEGLSSSQLNVLSACLDALMQLPPTDEPDEQVALLKTLRRMQRNEREFQLREKVVRLLRRNLGTSFGFAFGDDGYRPQRDVIQQWTRTVTGRFPDAAAQLTQAGGLKEIEARLAEVNWQQGDPGRGKKLFRERSCAQCHGGRRALGPDLAGVARRFSRSDLFRAMAAPDRDVSPRYQTTMIQTKNGRVYTGLVIYDSVDGVTLQNGTNQTFRIEAEEIAARRKLNASLMPADLLKGLSPRDLADLYAYLQTL